MDIYDFINSTDVADYCREIGKTWNPLEMAFIIGHCMRSRITDRHKAWQELMSDYPDMPMPAYTENEDFDYSHKALAEEITGSRNGDSLHKKLAEVIDYENRAFEMFITPESGAFYYYIIGDEGYHWWDCRETFIDY